MIKKSNYTLIYILFILLYSNYSAAQFIGDWEARPTIYAKYKPNDKLSFEAKYEHRLFKNFSQYKKSVTGVEVEYKIKTNSQWYFKPTLDYRFEFDNNQTAHDLRYATSLGFDVSKKLNIECTPILQHIISEGQQPVYFFRNELELTYQFTKKFSLFIFTENYQLIQQGFQFNTQKYGLGAEYLINSKSAIECKFDIKHLYTNKNTARLMLGYIFILH